MLFPQRFHEGLRSGAITLTLRNWTRPQAKVGGRYRTGGGDLVVTAMSRVAAGDVTDDDAARAGFDSAAAWRAEFTLAPETVVHRIEFRREDPAPAKPPPDLDDKALTARLDKLDGDTPWTRATLRLIGDKPEVRAGDLAAELGRERLPFKADVRKLKRLGLTVSLERGYRLSPRGQAYVDSL